jgi:hypothetical protein
MPKHPKDHDFVTVARRVVEQAIGEQLDGSPLEKAPNKSKRSAGGRVGGPARAISLTAKQRREIAAKAAKARWAGKSSATHLKKGNPSEEHRKAHQGPVR